MVCYEALTFSHHFNFPVPKPVSNETKWRGGYFYVRGNIYLCFGMNIMLYRQ
jgi:hypothetical protein